MKFLYFIRCQFQLEFYLFVRDFQERGIYMNKNVILTPNDQ